MTFSISGYVAEGIRCGQSNSPYTQTPDNYISNQTAFDTAYPSNGSNPRTDYFVFVFDEGTLNAGLLTSARFAWSKNEVIRRFDYADREGRFKLLPGNAITIVGILSTDSNTTRLKVTPPAQVDPWLDAPYRLSVGSTGSGMTWNITLVTDDTSFGSPAPGMAELSMKTGNLNWNTSDLTTYAGQLVRFQQQQFFDYTKFTGKIGFAPVNLTDPLVFLNPKPGTGQCPLLRFGYDFYLQTIEVLNDGALTPAPASGYVKWSLTTGRLAFNVTDASANAGIPVYYDGVVFARDLSLPQQVLGNIATPAAISGLPPVGVDLIFSLPGVSPYYQFPRFTYVDSSAFDEGKTGVVQVDPTTGAVKFSDADQVIYTGESVIVTFGDLLIERGISIRFLRTPVNLDGQQGSKDVTAIYTVLDAVWANPIIEFSQVSLPSKPMSTIGYPLTVKVEQGQGSYTNDAFLRLDVLSPPESLGYYIDFDSGTFYFAQRKNSLPIPVLPPAATVLLPDPLVSNVKLKDGSTVLVPGTDYLLDSTSGAVSFISNPGHIVAQGTNGSFSGNTFTDASADFIAAGVQPGFLLEVSSTAAKGIYTIETVFPTSLTTDVSSPSVVSGASYNVREDREILADRYFDEVVLVDPSTKVERIRFLGIAANSPRLNIPVSYVTSSRFRFGLALANQFSIVVLVTDDSSFTSPPAGTVEISRATGNLNFSTLDLGSDIYWVRELESKTEYTLSAGLGLIQFTDRLLASEEVLVTYTTQPPSTDPPTPPSPPITEYATFLIRKEITQDHPTPTSTLYFNIAGLPLASNPPPVVFRGGRPQALGTQCTVDMATSTITFLADSQITDALPHGAIVNSSERVYIDYYVTQAVGGEKTISVLYPPLLTATVNISETDSNGDPNKKFTVLGDRTGNFKPDYLLRIENEQTYLIGSSVYDSGLDQTTVTLYGNQFFQDTYNDPRLYVTSGPTPIISAPFVTPYFTLELSTYESIARGSNQFFIAGDRTASYRTGTILMFTDGGLTFINFLQVSGASYDTEKDKTKIVLTANAPRQYLNGFEILYRSVRPVFEPPTVEAQTSQIPALTQPYLVYRRITGDPGIILSSLIDYTINDSGKIVFISALRPEEEFSIFYVGYQTVSVGINLSASYTCQITPNSSNGLVGQILKADYYIFSPDSFYYRVETMTNFRGEYAQEISAKASSGSSGPQTSNVSQPNLFEKGRLSLYFDERHLANQDIIARSTLLFYNTAVNLLEAYLRALDGRVVGNNDGLFLFNGTTGAQHPPGAVTNQIDDVIEISPAPYTITFPPFAVISIGTFKKYYLPGPKSRFYPTRKDFFAVSAVTSSTQTGDEVADTGSTNVALVSNLHTRLAWAVITESTQYAGSNKLKVDTTQGSDDYARPPFKMGMKCVVQRRDGSFINDTSSPVTITAIFADQLNISGLADVADIGTTIYRSPIDDSAQTDPNILTYYVLSRDYSYNGDTGQITYIEKIDVLDNTPLVKAQALSGKVNLTNIFTAPFKFSALYGGVSDDDGDLSFPVQTPDPNCEQNGLLLIEDFIIHNATGVIRTVTTPPFIGTGSLDVTKTIITNLGGPFLAPFPQQYDLVRILSGLNGSTEFRRIAIPPGANTITVDIPFNQQDTGFTYEIAVSSLVVAGAFATFPTPTTLNDLLATFLTTAKVGYTVVITSGVNAKERRQIYEIADDNNLILDAPVSVSLVANSYRIDNSLATYGGTPSDYLTFLSTTLSDELSLYSDEQSYILDFLDQVFTNISTSAIGQTTATLPILIDLNATFSLDDITQADFVYIVSGTDAGIRQVVSVDSPTQITVDSPFPATLSGISYRIVSLFGVSKESAQALFVVYQSITALVNTTTVFRSLVNTRIPVLELNVLPAPPLPPVFDTESFTRGILPSDLDTRDNWVDTRIASITEIELAQNILASTDMLYDKRYSWISARIDLQNGLIVQQATAITNRVKAQQDFYNQLIKLLAVKES